MRSGLQRVTMVLVVVLAGWVGLSPTADALTRSATTVGFLSAKAKGCGATTRPATACGTACSDTAVPAPGSCGDGSAPRCCAPRASAPELPSCQARTPQPMTDCSSNAQDCNARGGRCGQCYLLGGLVLFAAGEPAADPDLRLLGRIVPGDHPPVIRNLVPPVPPPIGDLVNQVV